MGNIAKTLVMVLVSIQVFLGQSAHQNIVGNDGSAFMVDDTIKYLDIPERLENATEGVEFVAQVAGLDIIDRERAIVREILSGNLPSFSRKLKPVTIRETVNGTSYELTFFASSDYLAIGSDRDYLYIPLTATTAQYLADTMNCSLPTNKMADIIYAQAGMKLSPQPIPPSDSMTTVPVFWQHTDSIKQQIIQRQLNRSTDNIVAGHKKDVIISNKIYSADRTFDPVVIYGWHLGVNNPIQPVYNGHFASYADYSHGVRFIYNLALINGALMRVEDILKDSTFSALLSNEGVIGKPYYPKK